LILQFPALAMRNLMAVFSNARGRIRFEIHRPAKPSQSMDFRARRLPFCRPFSHVRSTRPRRSQPDGLTSRRKPDYVGHEQICHLVTRHATGIQPMHTEMAFLRTGFADS
jgi:hypothetical protein